MSLSSSNLKYLQQSTHNVDTNTSTTDYTSNHHTKFVRYRVVLFNSKSIKNKTSLLSAFVKQQSVEPDLIFITETWLSEVILDSQVCPEGYSIIRCDRINRIGGGVLVLYRKGLLVTNITTEESTSISDEKDIRLEHLCIEVKFSSGNDNSLITMCCIYLPPSVAVNKDCVMSTCEIIGRYNRKTPVIVLGDFNFPGINWKTRCGTRPSEVHFLDFCAETDMSQHVLENTCQNGTKESLLDLVLANTLARDIIESVKVTEPLSSTCDHKMLNIHLTYVFDTFPTNTVKYQPNIRKGNYSQMINELSVTDWGSIHSTSSSLQEHYDTFIDILKDSIKKNTPLRKHTSNNVIKIPSKIKKVAKQKAKCYQKMKTNHSFKVKYKILEKEYRRLIRNWTDGYETRVCNSGNLSFLYNYVRKRLKSRSEIPPIKLEDGSTLWLDADIANHFNNQFLTFMQEDNKEFLYTPTKTNNYLCTVTINETKVKNALISLKPKMSGTPENISSFVLKQIAPSIIKPLTTIFQISMESGCIPKQWRTSIVVPIYKSGLKNKVNNHRPVSLTSSFCRVKEIIIKDQLLEHLMSNGLLSSHEHGFIPGRSTTTQLLHTLNYWFQEFNNKNNIHIIYTDFSKAFDRVCHEKLLQILFSFGVRGKLLTWIRSWLQYRTQRVKIRDEVSEAGTVISGVPQGSVLGPLLFAIYINDIYKICTPNCELSLFADDCKIYSTDAKSLQNTLDNLKIFTDKRQLCLAPKKCVYLKITRIASITNQFSIGLQNIRSENSVKDLGIIISEDLKPHLHITKICRKAFQRAYQLLFSFKTNNLNILIRTYTTYIRPIVEHNSEIWSPISITDIRKIERVQEFFLKKIFIRCGIKTNDYYHRLHLSNLETLELRRKKDHDI